MKILMAAFYKILVTVLCLFIPIKEWRRAIRIKLGIKRDDLEKDRFLEVKIKKDTLLKNKSSAVGVFFGTSHIAYGFNPQYFSPLFYNLGSNSQDLFTSYTLYNLLNTQIPNLKTILIGYDVFSPGHDLSKTSSKFLCGVFSYLYNIIYPHYPLDEKSIQNFKKLDEKNASYSKINQNGYLNPPGIPLDLVTAHKGVMAHLRENKRNNIQNVYIEKLAKKIKDNNQTLTIIISPVHSEYKKMIPASDELFKDIFLMAQSIDLKIINFYDDPYFVDVDFYDLDHLNQIGARKFTEKLKALLQ